MKMRNLAPLLLGALIAATIAPGWAQDVKDAPRPAPLTWGQEPVEVLSSQRAQICINGLWQFVPMLQPAETQPSGGLAWINVPGAWNGAQMLPGLASGPAQGPAWNNFGNGASTWRAWYIRKINVPADWAGRSVLVSLQRVGTDAIVYANGKKCGTITWPAGEAYITRAVTPGGDNTLWIEVMATRNPPASGVPDPTKVDPDDVGRVPAKGLMGDVMLYSRPKGAHVQDVFIQTSTRQKLLTVDADLSDVPAAGPVHFVAHLMDAKGMEEKTFSADAAVVAGDSTAHLTWSWPNPRLWDLDQPNLYTLKLEATGAGLKDEYAQTFGFREFWTEGRNFYLNGTLIHLRPTSTPDGICQDSQLLINDAIKGSIHVGWNLETHGPYDPGERGSEDFHQMWAYCCDHIGYLQVIDLPSLSDFSPAGEKKFEETTAQFMLPYRNSPSVVMWATNPNRYGVGGLDEDPRVLGTTREATSEEYKKTHLAPARWCVGAVHRADPTRPAFNYSGQPGDVFSSNVYLDFEPLQDREEWLSAWAKSGTVPYQAVEFGTPWSDSFMRGRWGDSSDTEPWMTEFSAIYLGPEAYSLEPDNYRKLITSTFRGGQNYGGTWPQQPRLVFAPAFQKVEALFNRNTYRSWRMWGISGGMNPWDEGWGWDVYYNNRNANGIPYQDQPMPKFTPGARGSFPQTGIHKYSLYPFQPGGMDIFPAGVALMGADGPTLAYIAGPPEAFTAKDHNFRPGQKIRKQVALLNDERTAENYSYSWRAARDVQEVAHGEGQGRLAPAEIKFIPFTFTAPTINSSKAQYTITLTAIIGNIKHTDSFTFRVFRPSTAAAMPAIHIYDPVGKTVRMLQALGIHSAAWNGQGAAPGVLIIGRQALSTGKPLPFNPEAIVRNGGRVLVEIQNPDWYRRRGFRVAPVLARRSFPVPGDNPAVRGLDAEDFRDWTGSSTLVDPYPVYPVGNPAWRSPPHGWRWGSQGAVSSAPLEKPHLSSWRPLLECEFDLQYSPLMEMDYGKGRLTLCTLDLEDHEAADPAAERMARQLIWHVATAPLAPKTDGSVVYVGGDTDAAMLDSLGLVYARGTGIGPQTRLLIVGADAKVNPEQLRAYCQRGGKALFLARQSAAGPLGVTLAQVSGFHGSLNVPAWPETRGLSVSDLHWRTDADAWVIKDASGPLGADHLEVSADGLLGRISFGPGSGAVVICEIDPRALDADKLTYFRFTRWRETRTLAQILSNCGATFKADPDIFGSGSSPQKLAGLYYPDYMGYDPNTVTDTNYTDFKLSDDPYRYFRW